MTRERAAEAALVGIAAVWGLTFTMVQDAIAVIPTMAFLAYRFAGATAIVAPVFRRSLAALPRDGWRAGVLMGAYHYARYDNNDASAEVTHFLNRCRNYIGPGWLPRPGRPRWSEPGFAWLAGSTRKRTFAYTPRRHRRSPKRAPAGRTVHHEIVLFDQGPAEFPVATVRPRAPRARAIALAADITRWLAARWSWLRPRTVPVLVAALGMILVLISADYLAHQQAPGPAHITIQLR